MSDVALYAEERARTKARHRRWRRRARGCAVATAALIAGVAAIAGLTLLAIYWIDASALGRAKEQARAAGAPLTLEEIKALYDVGPEHAEATKRWQIVLDERLGAARSDTEGEGIPYVDWQRSDEAGNPPLRDARGLLAGEDLRIGGDYADSLRAAIEAAHEARRAGGVARFPVSLEDGVSVSLSHLGPLQRLATLIRLDMEVRLARGETDEALEDLLTMLAIVDILAAEPYAISHHYRFTIQGAARKGFEKLLDGGGLTDEQLRTIDEAFARTKAQESFRRSLAGERWTFVSLFENEETNMYDAMQIAEPWFKGSDFAKGLEWYGRLDQASESSLREATAEYKTIETEMTTIANDPIRASTYPLSLAYFPSMTYSLPAHQKGESCEAVVRTAIACERYRLAEGSFPPKLDDLVPRYLPSLPVDAYDGKPLRYAVDAKGAKVYSVGPDLVDNQGGVPSGSAAAAFASPDDVIYLRNGSDIADPDNEAPSDEKD